ncbi:MAG: AMP-binding protein [Planctomycetota bacterium]|jgi:acyl-CoA synthetase (AMP-forming)/AMP-acid ligase II
MAHPTGEAFDTTLSGLLRLRAADRTDTEALVYPAFALGGTEVRLTYAQLDARVDAIARGLIGLGIEAGEHVAVWAPNVPDWVPLEFALARIGAVLVTVNTALSRAEVAYVLQQSKAVAVLHTTLCGKNEASRALDGLFKTGDASVANVRRRVWLPLLPDDEPPMAVAPDGSVSAITTLETVVERGADVTDEALAEREGACRAEQIVNIQYTSGTTGFPKGVMLSHRNIVGNAWTLANRMGLAPDDRLAMVVPLFHCFGCVVCVLGVASMGATLCAIPAFEPGQALRLVDEEHCTILHGVPTMFSAMLAHEDAGKRNIRTLRAGFAAGAPCPVPLMKQIGEVLHCPGIAVTYGLTEASPGVSGSVPDAPLEVRCETIGTPLEHVETRIVNPATGKDAHAGKPGELWVRGPNVMLGYHDDPEATAAAITPEGWLRTGDQCVLGKDGNLRITGRIKDIIIRGGENIAPAEIENVLREHEDILEAAVIGVPDEHFGEIIGAALILKEGATLDTASYEALLKDRIAPFKVPERWQVFDALPLTGSGKVQKFKLRELFEAAERTDG